MFRNYLVIALRNLARFKGYATINIAGLAMGIACCLLIVQYIRYETSFDKHHASLEQLYRVSTEFNMGERNQKTATSPAPLAAALVNDFAEVEAAARMLKPPQIEKFLIRYKDKSFFQGKGIYADSNFFQILTYDFVHGDPNTALSDPFNVVISERVAKRIFGDSNPLQEVIKMESIWGVEEFTVTGVVSDKYRSHIDGGFYVSMISGRIGDRYANMDEWGGNNMFHTYARLSPNADVEALETKMEPWLDGYAAERLKQLGFSKRHYLEPLEEVYLNSDADLEPGVTGDIKYIWILGSIAVFILFIACINFMNLATAKATLRGHEVGVRKVIGATRGALTGQFMSEAFVYTGLSVLLGFAAAKLVLPQFNSLVATNLSLDLSRDTPLSLWLLGITLLTTLVAGGYPALYLSSFSPSRVFRGQFSDRLSARSIRRALVVLQFIVSIGLIQGVLIINKQIDYCLDKDLGYQSEAKLVIPLNTDDAKGNYKPLKTALLSDPRINMVGGTSTQPGKLNIEDMVFAGEGQTPDEGGHAFMHYIDPDFLELMDFTLVDGRLFSEEMATDTSFKTVVSELMVKRMGYTNENAVGKTIGFNWNGEEWEWTIIGIIRDFHSQSLHHELDGEVFFWYEPEAYNYMIADISTSDLESTLSFAQDQWKRFNPDEPIEFYFLNESLQENYQASVRVRGLVLMGTILAVIISCLGLLGLASFAAERRRKEFGIRRVLGASIGDIISLMTTDFMKLVMLALIVATPIAWYTMQGWLSEFPYHIAMPWWLYLIAGIAAALIAFTTVAFQTVRSQVSNPVESLRVE